MPSKAKPGVDLAALGARVVSVYGPFNSRVLIEMDVEKAADLFPDGLGAARRALVIEAAERDVALIRERDTQLGDSALAASAIAMAYEIEHPYNSATSKSMCQARLIDAMRELRELAPARETKDGIHRIADQLAERRSRAAGSAAAADLAGS